jgi:hypothetical protein
MTTAFAEPSQAKSVIGENHAEIHTIRNEASERNHGRHGCGRTPVERLRRDGEYASRVIRPL